MTLRVADTGVGIAPEHIPTVLEPFGQVETALSREHGGVGLGLPLSKRLAEMHDARLDIVSTPGRGTTITVSFPRRRVGKDFAPPPSADPRGAGIVGAPADPRFGDARAVNLA